MGAPKYVNYDEDGMGVYSDKPGQKSRVVGDTQSKAGAGRGKINPQPVNVSDEDYVSPADQYQADVESAERKSSKQNTDAYNASTSSMKSGGTASSRADGIAQRGKTRGTIVMCGGGMYKK